MHLYNASRLTAPTLPIPLTPQTKRVLDAFQAEHGTTGKVATIGEVNATAEQRFVEIKIAKAEAVLTLKAARVDPHTIKGILKEAQADGRAMAKRVCVGDDGTLHFEAPGKRNELVHLKEGKGSFGLGAVRRQLSILAAEELLLEGWLSAVGLNPDDIATLRQGAKDYTTAYLSLASFSWRAEGRLPDLDPVLPAKDVGDTMAQKAMKLAKVAFAFPLYASKYRSQLPRIGA